MTRSDYAKLAIMRNRQSLIMRKNNLLRLSIAAKFMAQDAIQKARGL